VLVIRWLAVLLVLNLVDAPARAGATEQEPDFVARIVPLSASSGKRAFRFFVGIRNRRKNVSRLLVGLTPVVKGYSYSTGPSSGVGSVSSSSSFHVPRDLRPPTEGEQFCETTTNRNFVIGIPPGGEVFVMGQLDLTGARDGRYPLEVRLEFPTLDDSTTDCAEVRYASSKARIPIVIRGETIRIPKQD
jgi:hypothetical protein